MSLLAPIFLAGLALVGLPVWLHRLQTQNPEREQFSSAMLLEQSEQRIYVKKKLRYLLLLAARILFLLLLILAFAKPVMETTAEVFAGDGVALNLIVIDSSFSMGSNGYAESAKTIAGEIIDEMEPGQSAQIISAADQIILVSDTINNKDTLKSALNTVTVGVSRLDFGSMMAGLNDLLDDYNQNTAIHLISDFQRTGLPARFADLIPRTTNNRTLELHLHRVSDSGASNLYIEYIRRWETGIQAGIRSINAMEQQKSLTLYVNDEERAQQVIDVPASGLSVVDFMEIDLEEGDNRINVVMSPDDNLASDDRRFAVIENTPPAPVLLLTTDIQSLSVTYLTTALETGNYAVETVNIADLDPRILQRYTWIIIDDMGAVNNRLAVELTEYLNAGGAVFAALGERASGLDTLPVTEHVLEGARISGQAQFKSISRIDTSHPVLANAPGWRSVNISRVVSLETAPDDRILISLEQGEPLLLERNAGAGRIFLLTTNLDNSWSDLPINSVFVSFMAEAATYLSGEHYMERHYSAGESILLKQAGGASGQVLDPQGNSVLDLADTRVSQNIKLNQTGFYEVYTTGRQMLIAVNPDSRESDPVIINEEMMERWRDTGNQQVAESDNVILDQEPIILEFWHALLILLVLIVLAESLLGNRYLDYRTGQ